MTVDVKVHPTVREFIIDTNGSALLVPDKYDWLWLLLKQHLDVPPSDYLAPSKEELEREYIQISLLDAHSEACFVKNASKLNHKKKPANPNMVHINTMFRWYLSPSAQLSISQHLRSQFKACFHTFVQGAVVGNPNLQQKEAIIKFCELHNLTLNDISEDMLIKSWQRSPQKEKLWSKKLLFCPILF